MPTYADALYQILAREREPLELFELVELSLIARKANTSRRWQLAKHLYSAAAGSEGPYVIKEYPCFKLRSYTVEPRRRWCYVNAAFNVLLGQRGKILELRMIAQLAVDQGLWRSHVDPAFAIYAGITRGLQKRDADFVQRGALRIGLRELHPLRPSVQKGRQAPETSDRETSPGIDVTTDIHEANLEALLEQRLSAIEPGLKLVRRQFACPGVGRIDLLCEDKQGHLVVIELKKFGAKTDSIIDQITRYMGYVKANVARKRQKVRGIIVVGVVDEKLRYAIAAIPSLEVRTFNVTVS